jgi:hypothetical protein
MAAVVQMVSFVPFTDEQLQELETRFGRIAVVRAETTPPSRWSKATPEPPYELVFRAPILSESDAFEGNANNDRAKAGATRTLCRQTIVGVSYRGKITIHGGERTDRAGAESVRKAWDDLRSEYPGAHLAATGQIQQLLGSVAEEQGKE